METIVVVFDDGSQHDDDHNHDNRRNVANLRGNNASSYDDDDCCRAFEWLTSPASLEPVLRQFISPLIDDNNSSGNYNNNNNNNNNSAAVVTNCMNKEAQEQQEDYGQRKIQSFHRRKSISISRPTAVALHVGCGTSLLGEWLVDHWGFDRVANADINPTSLAWLEARWTKRQRSQPQTTEPKTETSSLMTKPPTAAASPHQQTFHCVDFSKHESIAGIESGSMDLVIDKSTLDCGLCTSDMTSGLLREVYRCLKPNGGIYLVISFHHVDFILPLLSHCPGAQWHVTTMTIRRQVENLLSSSSSPSSPANDLTTAAAVVAAAVDAAATIASDQNDKKEDRSAANNGTAPVEPNMDITNSSITDTRTTWSSGSFQPNDQYHQTVNVFVCRRYCHAKNSSNNSVGLLLDDDHVHDDDDDDDDTSMIRNHNCVLDADAVARHVQTTCDQWFRTHNPMLTPGRLLDLQRQFESPPPSSQTTTSTTTTTTTTTTKPLEECYQILFNDEEREQLPYTYFVEDWEAFLATRLHLPHDCMTWETARDFLQEMQ